jgi:hypothetical protein
MDVLPSGRAKISNQAAARSTLFDEFIMVDWSGRAAPSPGEIKDSIWLARGTITQEEILVEHYPRREKAYDFLLDALVTAVGDGRRVLLGFDFVYGYPRGLAETEASQPERPLPFVDHLGQCPG